MSFECNINNKKFIYNAVKKDKKEADGTFVTSLYCEFCDIPLSVGYADSSEESITNSVGMLPECCPHCGIKLREEA